MARILGFHPRGPGSIPGVGEHVFYKLKEDFHNFILVAMNGFFHKLPAIQNSFLNDKISIFLFLNLHFLSVTHEV